ncbi:MAG: hypothetical protein ABIY55_25215 [Kofleriaceae bacterium]
MSEPPDDAAPLAPQLEPSASPEAIRLATSFQALADQLPNPWDESTDYFAAFAAGLAVGTALDGESFRRAAGVAAHYQIDLSPASARLAAQGAQDSWGKDLADKFRALEQAMTAALGELWLAHARGDGVIRVRMWLFGRGADGALIGLHSISTET